MKDNFSLRRLTIIGILGAISAILMFINFLLPFVPPFYRFDAAELPALFGAFFLGPSAGVLIISLKLLVKLLIQGSDTLLVGEMANFMANVAFVLPAALIYKKHRTMKGAWIGFSVGMICQLIASSLGNMFFMIDFYVFFFNLPEAVLLSIAQVANPNITDIHYTMVLYGILPFNLLKDAAVILVTFLIYKRTEIVICKKI